MFCFEHRQSMPSKLILLLVLQISIMSVIIILLIASISIAGLFLGAFLWNVKSGQYDDEASAPIRMLFDDEKRES
jgi:cbb3-type cytochrome oxidase maturation protein